MTGPLHPCEPWLCLGILLKDLADAFVLANIADALRESGLAVDVVTQVRDRLNDALFEAEVEVPGHTEP